MTGFNLWVNVYPMSKTNNSKALATIKAGKGDTLPLGVLADLKDAGLIIYTLRINDRAPNGRLLDRSRWVTTISNVVVK